MDLTVPPSVQIVNPNLFPDLGLAGSDGNIFETTLQEPRPEGSSSISLIDTRHELTKNPYLPDEVPDINPYNVERVKPRLGVVPEISRFIELSKTIASWNCRLLLLRCSSKPIILSPIFIALAGTQCKSRVRIGVFSSKQ